MTLLDVVVVALIQGLAEALPLGASGHLALFVRHSPTGLAAVTAAAEAGLAAALACYFWRDWIAMGGGAIRMAKGRLDAGGRLLLLVLAGTVPALALSIAFTRAGGGWGGPLTVSAALLVFGLFLLAADRLGVRVRRVEHMGWAAALSIGLLQAVALIPGVARLGLTAAAARLMGYERAEAARFSLLLAMPFFAFQAGETALALSHEAPLVLSPDLVIAASASFLSALLAAALLMAWLRRNSLLPFALWQMAVGAAALAWTLLR